MFDGLLYKFNQMKENPGLYGFCWAILIAFVFGHLGLLWMGSDLVSYAKGVDAEAMRQGKGSLVIVMLYSTLLSAFVGAWQFFQAGRSLGWTGRALWARSASYWLAMNFVMLILSQFLLAPGFFLAKAL